MRNTRLTEQQQTEMAARLGITEPKAPEDVTTYHQLLKEYEKQKDALKYESLGWRATLDETLESLQTNRERTVTLIGVIQAIKETSETVKLAWESWYKQLDEYENAIIKEFNRPENEFRTQIDEYRQELNKEIRSLDYSINKLIKQRDKQQWGTETWSTLQEEIKEATARQTLLVTLEDSASRLGYDKDTSPIFSIELVAQQVDKNREIVKQSIELITK